MALAEKFKTFDSDEIRGSKEKAEIISVTESNRKNGVAWWIQNGEKETRKKLSYKNASSTSTILLKCSDTKCKAQARVKCLKEGMINSKLTTTKKRSVISTLLKR